MAVQAAASGQTTDMKSTQRRDFFPYMLALPILLYETLFILIPIVQQIGSSFTSDVIGMGPVRWVGLANYDRLLHDRIFWNALKVTLTFMGGTVILAVGIGLLAALILN